MNTTKTKPSKTGIMALIATCFIQFCFGTAYIWSIFQTGISDTIFNGNNSNGGLVFSFLLAFLTIGSIVGGKIAKKYSSRVAVVLGGIILSLGFLLGGFVTERVGWLLWLTVGGMGGFGMGLGYTTTIGLVQNWFPAKRGMMTGLAVSSLGFGTVIFSPAMEALIIAFGGQGIGEQKTFMVMAGIFFFATMFGSIFLAKAPEQPATQTQSIATAQAQQIDYNTKELLRSPKYYILFTAFMLACMSGLMMIGFAKPLSIAKGIDENIAGIAVILIGLFNAAGRLTWGIIADKVNNILLMSIFLILTAIASFIVGFVGGYWIFVLLGLIGFMYGGLVSLFAITTSKTFGSKNVGSNYGFVLLGFGAGAIISSQIAGHFKNLANQSGNIADMNPAFYIAGACALAGLGLILLLAYMNKREMAKFATSNNAQNTKCMADTATAIKDENLSDDSDCIDTNNDKADKKMCDSTSISLPQQT